LPKKNFWYTTVHYLIKALNSVKNEGILRRQLKALTLISPQAPPKGVYQTWRTRK
jgi:hypothetical protein